MQAFVLSVNPHDDLKIVSVELPKIMLPIKGKPLLEYMILLGKNHNITDYIVNLFWLPERLSGYFGDGSSFGVKITYLPESKSLGTAGSLKKAENILSNTFFVFYADMVVNVDLSKALKFHRDKKAIATFICNDTVIKNNKLIKLDNDKIVKYVSPRSDFSDVRIAGLLILQPEIFKFILKDSKCSLEQDIFPRLIKENYPVYVYRTNEFIENISTPEKYEKVLKDIGSSGLIDQNSK